VTSRNLGARDGESTQASGKPIRGAILLLGLPFVGFTAKIGFEWITGQAVFAGSGGFVPVPLAHVVGGACGALVAWARPPGRHRIKVANVERGSYFPSTEIRTWSR